MEITNALAALNTALELDPVAMRELFGTRVWCNQELADHPSIQVREEDGRFSVGVIGLLNGILGVNPETQAGYLAAQYDDRNQLTGFIRFEPDTEEPEAAVTAPKFED